MNKVIDKGFRSCRFVSTIVKHPVCGKGGEETYQLGYNDFHNKRWWLSTSGYLNRTASEKDVWHYFFNIHGRSFVAKCGGNSLV